MAKPTKKETVKVSEDLDTAWADTQEDTKQETPAKDFVVPLIEINNHTNPFVTFLKEKDYTIKAVGFARIPGTKDYAAYTVVITNGKIEKIVCDEPNMYRVAEESAKINFVDTFIKSEEF